MAGQQARSLPLVLLLCIAVAIIAPPVLAATYTVGTGEGNLPTIQKAVDRAADGDMVIVQAGTYREAVTVPRAITLRGKGKPTLIAPDGASGLRLTGDGILVEGLSISAASGNGIEIAGSKNTIRDTSIDDAHIGILCAVAHKNEITGNTISRTTEAAIILKSSSSNVITGNTFLDNPQGVLADERSIDNHVSGNEEKYTANGLLMEGKSAREEEKYAESLTTSPGGDGANKATGPGAGSTSATGNLISAPAVTTGASTPVLAEKSDEEREFPVTAAVLLAASVLLGGGILIAGHRRARSRKSLQAPADHAGTLRPDTVASITLPAVHTSGFPEKLQDKYDDITYVGEGGLGRVFRATRKIDGRSVAVKIPIAFDETTGQSFLKEMRFWEELRHPNIVTVHSVNILPVPYVEMEYIPLSLERLKKPADIGTTVRIVAGIAAGLAYAHECGVIHRDIKPHNILLTDDLTTPKITDWGMGKILVRGAETSILGFSPNYAAPEQLAPKQYGTTGTRTDLYQLGVVFYELLTGTVPFSGESIGEISVAILTELPAPPSLIRPGTEVLDAIVLRCLEKAPERRYQSAVDLIADLERYLAESRPGGAGEGVSR